jgi:hypothetical protein
MDIQDLINHAQSLPVVGGKAADHLRQMYYARSAADNRSQVNNILAGLRDRLGQADTRSAMGPNELFGESMQRSTDNIRENANNTKQTIARLAGLSGDNVTGASGVAMNRANQNANRAVGDVITNYSDRATSVNERALSRGDQLMRLLFGGQNDLLRMDLGLENQALTRNLQREQAKKQRRADMLGNILGIGSSFLNPAGGATE